MDLHHYADASDLIAGRPGAVTRSPIALAWSESASSASPAGP